jgi:hypothetical protein
MKLKSCVKLAVAVFAAAQLGVPHFLHSQTPSDSVPVVDSVRQAGPDLSDYVSPNLDPDEQAMVRQALNNLPRAMRERIAAKPADSISFAVVDGATNTIHYNRPEEVGSYEVVPALNLPGSQRPDFHDVSDARSETGTIPETKDPGPYGGSGPYRRVYTIPVPAATPSPESLDGPNYEQKGTVTTYCKSGIFKLGGPDRGYLYMGGWSPTWNSVSGDSATSSAVDAGLVYNYMASTQSQDDYSMFINLGNHIAIMSKGNGGEGDPPDTVKQPPHIDCSPLDWPVSAATTAQIWFSIVPSPVLHSAEPGCYEGKPGDWIWIGFPDKACTTFALVLEAESYNFDGFKDNAHVGIIMWVAPDVSEGGWAKTKKIVAQYWNGKYNVPGYVADTTCGGCIFKWMTSIAQKTQNLSDGAVFGAAWFLRGVSGYAWGKSELNYGAVVTPLTADITDCSEYPLWHTPYPAKLGTDCTNTPNGLSGLAQSIHVRNYKVKGEWDIIDLNY